MGYEFLKKKSILYLNCRLPTLLITEYEVDPVMEIRAYIFTFKSFSIDMNELFRGALNASHKKKKKECIL
jgi:hypothetical protein